MPTKSLLKTLRVGTAAWAIPKQYASAFPADGTHLEKYAGLFPAVEINSSFYRPHRPGTYERWAASVPSDFKFAAKIPREITHRRKLVDVADLLETFLAQVRNLGGNLGPLLVQLPPSFRYDSRIVSAFFKMFRARFDGHIVCEPRHLSWFTDQVDTVLRRYKVARVAADPACTPRAALPGGWPGLVYWRLHGSPKIYYSNYEPEALDAMVRTMKAGGRKGVEVWCIFDNTALGFATVNALEVLSISRSV